MFQLTGLFARLQARVVVQVQAQVAKEKSNMGKIILKNGTVYNYDNDITGKELAVALNTVDTAVLCSVNGVVTDLSTTLTPDTRVDILTIDSPGALDVLRHSTAHLLARAVKILFPDAKLAVGPTTENGFFYDFHVSKPFTPEDLELLEKEMQKLVKADIPFEKVLMPKQEAVEMYQRLGEKFKLELLDAITDDTVSVYKLGDTYDLCRGPHFPSTKLLGDAFKITKSSGAYWKADKNSDALQRVYGVAFPNQSELSAYFTRLEEAALRDHRKIGADLDLFHIQDIAPGEVFWHTKGWTLYRTLRNFIRARIENDGYKEVNTPMLLDRVLWEKSGHWEKFAENMFVTESAEERTMALKPMNCPCHVQIFNQGVVSYRDLPWRMAEFGSCHRFEPSGALHGLMRVRGFVQDDAHIFCTKEQIVSETQKFCDLLREIYKTLGFESFFVKFSDRPAKRAGSDEIWDLAEKSLMEAATQAGLDYTLNPGEGAFYGPKLEFVLKDCLGRDWQCGTLQVDFVLPCRLDAYYVTEQGTKEHPVMLHRAVLGSMERFIGILIEQYAGRFPTWLAPVQAVVATITEEAGEAALALFANLKENGIRAEVDIRNEKISYKVREHAMQKIPYLLVLGRKEVSDGTVTVRMGDVQKAMTVAEAIDMIAKDSVLNS
ncbi:MAG: threonine--tRNA ligase [Holosporales bacterium]|jgi:threonyl-tRNA synthetase|nr:threonine--tRNA ligase [Holosporales bacterium]